MMILMPLVDWDVACIYIYIYTIYNAAPPVPQINMLVTVVVWLPMTSGGHRSGDITTGCPRPDADHDPVMGLALPAAFGMPLGGWWVVHGCHP